MRLKRKTCLNLIPFPKKKRAIAKNRKPEKVPENGFTIWVRLYPTNSVKSRIFGYLWKCDNSWLYLNILGLEPYAPLLKKAKLGKTLILKGIRAFLFVWGEAEYSVSTKYVRCKFRVLLGSSEKAPETHNNRNSPG